MSRVVVHNYLAGPSRTQPVWTNRTSDAPKAKAGHPVHKFLSHPKVHQAVAKTVEHTLGLSSYAVAEQILPAVNAAISLGLTQIHASPVVEEVAAVVAGYVVGELVKAGIQSGLAPKVYAAVSRKLVDMYQSLKGSFTGDADPRLYPALVAFAKAADAPPEWFVAMQARVTERRAQAKQLEDRAAQRLARVKALKKEAKKLGVSVYPGWDSSAEDKAKGAQACWGLAAQYADDKPKFDHWCEIARREDADADGRVQSFERIVQEYKSRKRG